MSGRRVLVAGIGNVFLGDDGFGVEVVRRLDAAAIPGDVDVEDFGIRGIHLAYELLADRYHTLVLVDAVPLDAEPGTIAVLDATSRLHDDGLQGHEEGVVDAHSMSPDLVLTALRRLGGHVERVLVVGCQPGTLTPQMGLSAAVEQAVDEAVDVLTTRLASDFSTDTVPSSTGRSAP
jgi:hydrogenase maturation protease